MYAFLLLDGCRGLDAYKVIHLAHCTLHTVTGSPPREDENEDLTHAHASPSFHNTEITR